MTMKERSDRAERRALWVFELRKTLSVTEISIKLDVSRERVRQYLKNADRINQWYADHPYNCHKCGTPTAKEAPIAPAVTVCEDCCEKHKFAFDRIVREWQCIHCKQLWDGFTSLEELNA